MIYSHKNNTIKPRFCRVENGKIQNHVPWSERELVQSGKPLLQIEGNFDLTPETARSRSTTAVTVMATGADWKKVEALWEKDEKIPGEIFLTVTGVLIWVSKFDRKHFDEGF